MSEVVSASTTFFSDRRWSVRDIERLPEGYRYEIIEGVLYMAPMPAWYHAIVLDNVYGVLRSWVSQQNLGRVLPAQTGVYLNDVNYVDPDLVFLRPDQFPVADGRATTATLAIEVLSPSNLRAPRSQREDLFHRLGIEEIWHIDHRERSLEVRRRTEREYNTTAVFTGDAVVTSALFPGLQFSLGALWEGLPEGG